MENKIKFRGQKIYSDEWVYGNLVVDCIGDMHIIPFIDVVEVGRHLIIDSDEHVFFKQETIGQYTGKKDMYNVNIYEGDILEVTDEMNTFNEECIVKWFEDGAYWNTTNLEEGLGDLKLNYYIRVIGNIHEIKKI